MDKNKLFYWNFLLINGIIFVSSQRFLDICIAQKNCFNVTVNVVVDSEDVFTLYRWILSVDGQNVNIAQVFLNESYILEFLYDDNPYSGRYLLELNPVQLSKENLLYNASLTFHFTANDTAHYQIGLRSIFAGAITKYSTVFEKPKCQGNGRKLFCKDQSCFCDTNVTEICPNDVNVTHQCLYSSKDLESSNATINGKCPEESLPQQGYSWWAALLIAIAIIALIGIVLIVKQCKSNDKSQKSTIDNEEAKSLQETNA